MRSSLIYVMTLAFGKQKMGDVFRRKLAIGMITIATHMLHSVTRQSLIARKLAGNLGRPIVQTRMKAVKPVVKKMLFSVMIAKPAYQ